MAIESALQTGAAFVACPCCVGKLKFSLAGGSSKSAQPGVCVCVCEREREREREKERGGVCERGSVCVCLCVVHECGSGSPFTSLFLPEPCALVMYAMCL
jgi:hypothetical protein